MSFFKQEQKKEIEINFQDVSTLETSVKQIFNKKSSVVIRFDGQEEISKIKEIFTLLLKMEATNLELNFNSLKFSEDSVGDEIASFLQDAKQIDKISFIFSNVENLPGIEAIASGIKNSNQELKFSFDYSDVMKEKEILLITKAIKDRSNKFVLDLSEISLTQKAAESLLDCLQSKNNFLLFINDDIKELFPDTINKICEQTESNRIRLNVEGLKSQLEKSQVKS